MAEQEAPACRPLPEPLQSLWQSLDGDAVGSRACLCYDGVLRSLDNRSTVLDAIGLTEKQITHLHTVFPLPEGFDKFKGIDGTKVPIVEWMNPEKGLLPSPISEEAQVQSSQWQDTNPDVVVARRERAEQARNVARQNIRGNPELYGRVAYEKEMQRAEQQVKKASVEEKLA
jgi:hypothetical protein